MTVCDPGVSLGTTRERLFERHVGGMLITLRVNSCQSVDDFLVTCWRHFGEVGPVGFGGDHVGDLRLHFHEFLVGHQAWIQHNFHRLSETWHSHSMQSSMLLSAPVHRQQLLFFAASVGQPHPTLTT